MSECPFCRGELFTTDKHLLCFKHQNTAENDNEPRLGDLAFTEAEIESLVVIYPDEFVDRLDAEETAQNINRALREKLKS
jgi:hypothetical protein